MIRCADSCHLKESLDRCREHFVCVLYIRVVEATTTHEIRGGAGAKGTRSRDVAAHLRARIESLELPIGRFLPTERELQESFGASRTTIRKALSQLVDEGYARNVPNRGVVASSGVSRARTRNVALIDNGLVVAPALATHLGTSLRGRDYNLLHFIGSCDAPMEAELERAADAGFSGALVWLYRGFPDSDALRAVSRRLPIVALDHPLGDLDTDRVTFDHCEAGYLATSHLIRLGCTRIAVAGMLDMLAANHARFSGYLKAMFAHGLQPQPRDLAFTRTSGMISPTSGVAPPDTFALRALLSEPERPDGIVILGDDSVPAIIELCHELGLDVPDDVRLAALSDDLDISLDGLGLTAIAHDWSAFASAAGDLLVRRIEDPTSPFEVRQVGQTLNVRGLCGASREDWSAQPIEAPTEIGRRLRSSHRYTSSLTSTPRTA